MPHLTRNAWRKLGTQHEREGQAVPLYPDNESYMLGFTSGEPIRITRQSGSRIKKNPIVIVGNPPHEIHATIEGVIYNRCLEIRAEKTGHHDLSGLYYHPFLRASKVQVLALSTGDILIRSESGEKLWSEV